MRRIWSEDLPHDVVRAADTLDLLRRFELELIVAVRPWTMDSACDVVAACHDRGVSVVLWPMLADEHGRWANVENAQAFADFVDALHASLARRGLRPRGFAVDLEPAIERLRGFTSARRTGSWPIKSVVPSRSVFEQGVARLVRTVRDLRASGYVVLAAALPVLLHDAACGWGVWQRALGTPIPSGTDLVHIMAYTSLLEGWSRGALDRADALAILAGVARRVGPSFGPRAGLALGAVGTGAFGNEPTYRAPSELAEDVAVARAMGVDDLSLFDLAGVLARSPAEAWLEAFVGTEGGRSPAATWKSRLAQRLLDGSAWVARGVARLR